MSELAWIIPVSGRPEYWPEHPAQGPVQPPSSTLPIPPPGVGWPPPPTIDNGLPPFPIGPNNTLPVVPGIPVYPDNTLPESLPPGAVYPPLPPQFGTGKIIALVIVFGVGYRWAVLDPSLVITPPIAPTPAPK